MITSALIFVPVALLSFVVGLLPTGTLPSGVSSAIATMFGYLAGWNTFFPIDTLVQVLGYALAFRLLMWTFETAVRLYGLVRGTR